MVILRGVQRYTLRDGRDLLVRSVEPSQARAVRDLLDAVAGEPSRPLLRRPGEERVGLVRAELRAAAVARDHLLLGGHMGKRLASYLALAGSANPYSSHVCEVGVVVAPDARRQGVATLLMRAAVAWAADSGFRRMTASALPHNEPALAFLSACGFVCEGRRAGQLALAGELVDELLLGKELQGVVGGGT
jgi:GNAT superfamily N-acetyltransferase